MTIRDFQSWTAAHDQSTGWEALSLLQVLAHLMEEVGEVAQSINRIYHGGDEHSEAQRAALAREVADVLWFLTKIANRFGVDIEGEAERLAARMRELPPNEYRSHLEHAITRLASDAARAATLLAAGGTGPPAAVPTWGRSPATEEVGREC
ncbi:MAG: MazG nucleotide pyrophosphohydrolase domain-containing protein [Candidatus Latescibacterota bacterium]